MNDKDIALKLKIEDKQSAERLAEGLCEIRCMLGNIEKLANHFSTESVDPANPTYTTGVFNSVFALVEYSAKGMRAELADYGWTLCKDSEISTNYA